MKGHTKEARMYSADSRSSFPIHIYSSDSGSESPLHRHQELELITARSGEVSVHFVTESVHLTHGQLLMVNSGVLHSLDCSGGGVCAYIMFLDELIAPAGSDISLKYVKPLVMNTEIPYVLLDGASLWHREMFSLQERIGALLLKSSALQAQGLDYPEYDSVCPELEIHCFLAELWRTIYANIAESSGRGVIGNEYAVRRRTQTMTDFIRQNYRSDITLADIAASANISKSEASRCFQSCLRVSPVSYLLRYRTEMAAHLLLNSSMTIDAISIECGFGSASYFCRIFRRYAGVTPGAYRKGARNDM